MIFWHDHQFWNVGHWYHAQHHIQYACTTEHQQVFFFWFHDMFCSICYVFYLACWRTHFLILQLYACKFCSSKFWWISKRQQICYCWVLNTFQFHCQATTTSLTYHRTNYPDLTLSCFLYEQTHPWFFEVK